MKKSIIISLLIFLFIQTFAHEPGQIQKTIKESFWVNGNCEMCQSRIQKAALSVKGVKMATWSIESKMLTVLYNPEKCDTDAIKKAIAEVGHDNDTYKAPDEVYNELHSCCKYERI